MKTRERAIMDYTRRMAAIDADHASAVTDATEWLLEYLQAGNFRSREERLGAERRWWKMLDQAYIRWSDGQSKAHKAFDAALAADPAVQS